EHGGVEELEPRMRRPPALGVVVELELVGLEPPVVLPRLAGGELGVLEAVLVLAEELQAVRRAARRILPLQEEMRRVEGAGVVERPVAQARAEEPVDAALQARAFVRLYAPELAVVAQHVAEDRELVLLDLRAAARLDLHVAHALEALGVD